MYVIHYSRLYSISGDFSRVENAYLKLIMIVDLRIELKLYTFIFQIIWQKGVYFQLSNTFGCTDTKAIFGFHNPIRIL